MRLINTRTLVLEEYFGDQIPKYAILSHTWRNEEFTFKDWQAKRNRFTAKKGYLKIVKACSMALKQSIEYVWVDTNCINKDSSSELSEAINSMFAWYQRSAVCFVYLDDFHYEDSGSLAKLGASRWFTRGWTLQELLAPRSIEFFDASWVRFGTKQSLLSHISRVTSIQIQYLIHPDSIRLASISKRMSWAATRSTTREEDMAYCLLGIFEINMPLLYGEGAKAFIRLQEEIIQHSNDHTIFCWSWPPTTKPKEILDWNGCLAPMPMTFRHSGDFVPTKPPEQGIPTEFQITNSGLRITLSILDGLIDGFKLAVLNARNPANQSFQLCICIKSMMGEGFARSQIFNQLLNIPVSWANSGTTIYLGHERDPSRRFSTVNTRYTESGFREEHLYAILPVSSTKFMEIDRTRGNWKLIDSYGPALGLMAGDEENLWYAQMEGKNGIKVYFEIRIKQPQDGTWEVTIELQHSDDEPGSTSRSTTQQLSLSSKSEILLHYTTSTTIFTLATTNTGRTGMAAVRPIFISSPDP